jgi:ribosomal protein S3
MLTERLSSRFLQAGYSKLTAHTFNTRPQSYSVNLINSLINSSFAPLKIIWGKVVIERTATKVIILIPYYSSGTDNLSIKSNLINILGEQLAQITCCPVELRIIRLFSAYLDADVLAKFISSEIQSGRFRTVILSLFSHIGPINPSLNLSTVYTGSILGIKVRLAGRLVKEPSIPRQTIQTASIGTFTSNRHLHIIQISSHTTTNAKGAYTVKVWLALKA